MDLNLNHFINNIITKNNFENDRLYDFNVSQNTKLVVKKKIGTSLNEPLSVLKEINGVNYGIEISRIPRHFTFYLGMIHNEDEILNSDFSSVKFFIKVYDTYNNKIASTENSNILNVKGVSLRFYLPNSEDYESVALYNIKNNENKFSNKFTYNDKMKRFELEHKGDFGDLMVKSFKYQQNKFYISKKEEKTEKEEKIEKSEFTESNTIWIACLSILGGLVIILILYLIYYLLTRNSPVTIQGIYEPPVSSVSGYSQKRGFIADAAQNAAQKYKDSRMAMTPRYIPGKMMGYLTPKSR
jgi:hypothetical protein